MPSPRHTFLFADLAGFTALTEAHGDEDAADLVGGFCRDVRDLLAEHGAEEVKALGDALMLHVREPDRAVELGLRVVGELGARSGFPVVRVGMHTGAAVERGGDWFGATVNLAARVSALSGGGEVLITEAVRLAAGAMPGVELRSRGVEKLRNMREPVHLYTALRDDGVGPLTPHIDPVCRMAVDPETSAGSLMFADVRHHFCSLACARAFADAPSSYAPPSARPRA